MSKEEALKELESLRGKVSDFYLDHIIKRVKKDFDDGFAFPAVLVDINNYSEEEHLIYVLVSFQESVNITTFFRAVGYKEQVSQCHLKPNMVDWIYNAKEKYQQEFKSSQKC
ncbi:hypothetical protein G3M74_16640 [Paenibacillus polymyxa]|nr:hypothetical protein [Paenibacillus polymyxa]